MDLYVSVKGYHAVISWDRAEADYFRVFFKKKDEFVEYAKVFDSRFITASLLPFGVNTCYVQAIKNGVITDETPKRIFNIEKLDTIMFKNDNDEMQIHYGEFPKCENYRLYSDNGDNIFNGRRNSNKTSMILHDDNENISYKIKPYKVNSEGEREILYSSENFKCMQNEFEAVTVHKSYGNSVFLSWLYQGRADGFEVYQTGFDYPVFTTVDGLRHYVNLKNYTEDTQFYVKAFINSPNGRIFVKTSESVSCKNIEFEEPKISLIIPAYNAKDYIARSIDSALASTFKGVEIVIVNDGSTDSTQEIIDWYASNYSNIVSLQKENGGVADTRNVGIKAATGEYIAFMDNDDLIRPDMLEKLYTTITKNNCDIAVAPLYRLSDKGYSVHCELPFEVDVAIDIDKYLDILYTQNFYNCAIWNKLYRASLVKEHPLGILKYEDVSWTPCILSWAKTFCFLNTPFYEWDRKLRPETFGQVLAKMPENDLYENRKLAMMFFVENGNPEKISYLREIAKRRLERYNRMSNHAGYKELISQLNSF